MFVPPGRSGFKIKVYNHVTPKLGTGNVAVFVFSDQRAPLGKKTRLVLQDDQGTIVNTGNQFTGFVDLRRRGTRQYSNQRIGGMPVSNLASFEMSVKPFRTLNHGEYARGSITFTPREDVGAGIAEKKFTLKCRYYKKSYKGRKTKKCRGGLDPSPQS